MSASFAHSVSGFRPLSKQSINTTVEDLNVIWASETNMLCILPDMLASVDIRD